MLYKIILHILYFFCYSFIGWIVESTYCSFGEKKLVNRGFLTGPVVPIYGAGTMTMAICLTPLKNLDWAIPIGSHSIPLAPFMVFFIGIIVCDIVEFFTSYVMEKLFHARWWDYSNKKFNIQGRICLQHSMYWGVGSVIFLYLIHPITVACFDRLIEKYAYIFCVVFLLIFIVDIIHATIKAMDVKKFLDKLRSTYDSLLKTKNEIKSGVKLGAKSSKNYIGAKYTSFKSKIESWKSETAAQIKNMTFSSKKEKDKGKKESPNHHLKSYPQLYNYTKNQFEKVTKLLDELKNGSDDDK